MLRSFGYRQRLSRCLGKGGHDNCSYSCLWCLEVPTCGGGLMSEAQEETKVRSRITVWSVALGTSLAVAYFYLLLLLSALSSGRDLFSLSFHWLSVSLVVAAVLQYLWFRRVVPPEGVYTALVSQAGWARRAALSSLPPTERVAEGDLLM